MTDTQFVISSLITAYVLGWTFGAIFKYFNQIIEASS